MKHEPRFHPNSEDLGCIPRPFQPFVASLGEAELTLDQPERVLYLCSNSGFELLGFVQQAAPRRVLIQRPPFAGVGIRKQNNFFTGQQAMILRDIVNIGRCADHGVHQARLIILPSEPYMRVTPHTAQAFRTVLVGPVSSAVHVAYALRVK